MNNFMWFVLFLFSLIASGAIVIVLNPFLFRGNNILWKRKNISIPLKLLLYFLLTPIFVVSTAFFIAMFFTIVIMIIYVITTFVFEISPFIR